LPCERNITLTPHTPAASATAYLFLFQIAMLFVTIYVTWRIVKPEAELTHTRNTTKSEEEARDR
jgi:hypothetical protein